MKKVTAAKTTKEQRRRAAIGDQPFAPPYRRLSKAALSGPSVCLRARAPCPLRVSCLRSIAWIAPSPRSGAPVPHPPGPRGRAARAAGLRSGGSLGQDRLIARRSAHARTDCAPPRILCKIDDNSVPVFDTGATNLFIVVPTLTVPDRWIFS